MVESHTPEEPDGGKTTGFSLVARNQITRNIRLINNITPNQALVSINSIHTGIRIHVSCGMMTFTANAINIHMKVREERGLANSAIRRLNFKGEPW